MSTSSSRKLNRKQSRMGSFWNYHRGTSHACQESKQNAHALFPIAHALGPMYMLGLLLHMIWAHWTCLGSPCIYRSSFAYVSGPLAYETAPMHMCWALSGNALGPLHMLWAQCERIRVEQTCEWSNCAQFVRHHSMQGHDKRCEFKDVYWKRNMSTRLFQEEPKKVSARYRGDHPAPHWRFLDPPPIEFWDFFFVDEK